MEFNDKRLDLITKKIGLSHDIASWCIRLHKKYALWVANKIKEQPDLYPARCNDFENIIDWKKDHPNINLNDLTFSVALRRTKEHLKHKEDLFKKNEKSLKNEKVVLDLGKYKWVELVTKEDTKEEGDAMSHCVANYSQKTHGKLFSLRDEFNMPHVTVNISNEQLNQYKGKSNSEPKGQFLSYFFKLIEKNPVKKIYDNTFFNSLIKNQKGIDELDKHHAHLINFEDRLKYGMKVPGGLIYDQNIIQVYNFGDGHIFSLPEFFKLLGEFDIAIQNNKSKFHIGDNSTFSDNVKITSLNTTIGDNVRIGGNLEIHGGLDNIPKNLRVGGDVKLKFQSSKHTQNDLLNALEGIYLGGYLDIDIVKEQFSLPL